MKKQRKPKSAGRPKCRPADVRRQTMGVRVSSTEWDTLCRKADALGIAPTTWMRQAALGKATPRAPVPAINRQAYAELSRLAANLNQLARAAHENRVAVPAALLDDLYAQVQALRLGLLGAGNDREDE